MSSVPFALLAALPFVLITPEVHIITPTNLQSVGLDKGLYSNPKHFYKTHLQAIVAQLDAVRAMGSGPAEEWLKGLPNQGKERIADSARWERWEASGALRALSRNLAEYDAQESPVAFAYSMTPGSADQSFLAHVVSRARKSKRPSSAYTAFARALEVADVTQPRRCDRQCLICRWSMHYRIHRSARTSSREWSAAYAR